MNIHIYMCVRTHIRSTCILLTGYVNKFVVQDEGLPLLHVQCPAIAWPGPHFQPPHSLCLLFHPQSYLGFSFSHLSSYLPTNIPRSHILTPDPFLPPGLTSGFASYTKLCCLFQFLHTWISHTALWAFRQPLVFVTCPNFVLPTRFKALSSMKRLQLMLPLGASPMGKGIRYRILNK